LAKPSAAIRDVVRIFDGAPPAGRDNRSPEKNLRKIDAPEAANRLPFSVGPTQAADNFFGGSGLSRR
jgi:hypothetical protein